MRVLVAGLAIVLSLLVAAPLEAQSGPRNCTRTSQNLFVRDVLDDVLPVVPASCRASTRPTMRRRRRTSTPPAIARSIPPSATSRRALPTRPSTPTASSSGFGISTTDRGNRAACPPGVPRQSGVGSRAQPRRSHRRHRRTFRGGARRASGEIGRRLWRRMNRA